MNSSLWTSEWLAKYRDKRAKQLAEADGHPTTAAPTLFEAVPNMRVEPVCEGLPYTKENVELNAKQRLNKFHNQPTDGYDSKKEAKRAFELRLMQDAGQIRNLREQVSYVIVPKQEGERSASYVADFEYEDFIGGAWVSVTEDCKGVRTPEYVLKRKLMLFVHGIRIRET